jgi:hypothetical protein
MLRGQGEVLLRINGRERFSTVKGGSQKKFSTPPFVLNQRVLHQGLMADFIS